MSEEQGLPEVVSVSNQDRELTMGIIRPKRENSFVISVCEFMCGVYENESNGDKKKHIEKQKLVIIRIDFDVEGYWYVGQRINIYIWMH